MAELTDLTAHEAIAAGETYQVNYTYRLHGQAYGSPIGLYRALRARQPVSYGALVALPRQAANDVGAPVEMVLSRSPELFLRHEAGLVTARPMKGTAARHAPPEGDSETARLLAEDTKNRAENLMIVDLLRNDLGRIAQIGSVKVPELFSIEPYSTVFQMTSTVQARLRPEVGLPELLRAGEIGALICMHAEHGLPIDILVQRALAAGHTAPIYHALTRPEVAEATGTERAIALAEMAKVPVYIVHLSAQRALPEFRGDTFWRSACL